MHLIATSRATKCKTVTTINIIIYLVEFCNMWVDKQFLYHQTAYMYNYTVVLKLTRNKI